jgi:hypothetical protein
LKFRCIGLRHFFVCLDLEVCICSEEYRHMLYLKCSSETISEYAKT